MTKSLKSALSIVIFIGAFADTAVAGAARERCLSAERTCNFRCSVKSTEAELGACEADCTLALDTCFSFADVLEQPSQGGGGPTRKVRPEAFTGNAVRSPN